jgi:hypothetical protein
MPGSRERRPEKGETSDREPRSIIERTSIAIVLRTNTALPNFILSQSTNTLQYGPHAIRVAGDGTLIILRRYTALTG